MTACNHSDRILCKHCAEAEIRNGSMKPIKDTLEAASAELNEAARQLFDPLIQLVEDGLLEINRWWRKMKFDAP